MNINVDPTENLRRARLAAIHGAVASQNPQAERQRREAAVGQVWDTDQLGADFEVLGFLAPYVVVRRRSDRRQGSLEFQHAPRLSFNFVLD